MAHVEKRGPRKYRARYRGADGQERSQTFDTERAAKQWLATVTTSQLRGEWVDPSRSRQTVGAWADEWLAGRVHLKPKTVAGYESLLKTQVLPTWGSVPLAQLSNADVAGWVAKMRSSGLSPSRVRQAYHLLTSMLDEAVLDRRISANPAASVKLPRLPMTTRRYLTHDQLAQLASECGEYRTLVLVLGYCGLRWGEAAALRVRSVDLMRRRIDVSEAVTEVNGRATFGTPKTHARRAVPVPAFLVDELAAQVAGKDAGAFVFPAPRGGVLRANGFRRRAFDAAAQTIGLEGLVPHELRHTAASLAISAGASVKSVQSMLGHSSATLTVDRYGHLYDDELGAVADRLDVAARAAEQIANNSRPERGLTVVPLDRAKRRDAV